MESWGGGGGVTDAGRAVFLSYASQDADASQNLCNVLRAAGIEVWFDQSELRGGDAWDALIRKQIKGRYLFVPIISANTQSREEGYFRREWNLAVARNPLDTGSLYTLGWLLFFGGQLKEAAAIQQRLIELDPAFINAHSYAAKTSLLMGKKSDALAEALKETEELNRLPSLALVYWAMERRTDADATLRQLESKFAQVAAYDIAAAHAYRGETDAAVIWLERAYAQRDGGMVLLKVDPLLRKMNLPE